MACGRVDTRLWPGRHASGAGPGSPRTGPIGIPIGKFTAPRPRMSVAAQNSPGLRSRWLIPPVDRKGPRTARYDSGAATALNSEVWNGRDRDFDRLSLAAETRPGSSRRFPIGINYSSISGFCGIFISSRGFRNPLSSTRIRSMPHSGRRRAACFPPVMVIADPSIMPKQQRTRTENAGVPRSESRFDRWAVCPRVIKPSAPSVRPERIPPAGPARREPG